MPRLRRRGHARVVDLSMDEVADLLMDPAGNHSQRKLELLEAHIRGEWRNGDAFWSRWAAERAAVRDLVARGMTPAAAQREVWDAAAYDAKGLIQEVRNDDRRK